MQDGQTRSKMEDGPHLIKMEDGPHLSKMDRSKMEDGKQGRILRMPTMWLAA
jgi:hypothetical protein